MQSIAALTKAFLNQSCASWNFSAHSLKSAWRIVSEGQKKKVLIARSLCEKAHLLVWDEPLNFIDVISRMQLETLLKECVPTVIFVEHDRRFVENVATKIIRL